MSQPDYRWLGPTAQHSDTKTVRWARRLGEFQNDKRPGADEKFNPNPRDTPYRLLHKLVSSVNSEWTSVQAGMKIGQGEPHGTPTPKRRVWIQQDSLPPDRLWVYYDGAWS